MFGICFMIYLHDPQHMHTCPSLKLFVSSVRFLNLLVYMFKTFLFVWFIMPCLCQQQTCTSVSTLSHSLINIVISCRFNTSPCEKSQVITHLSPITSTFVGFSLFPGQANNLTSVPQTFNFIQQCLWRKLWNILWNPHGHPCLSDLSFTNPCVNFGHLKH